MSEYPILFSGPMVRAIQSGAKTQTRRLAQTTGGLEPDSSKGWGRVKPGDRLWVRETFAVEVPGCPGGVSYRADHRDPKGDGPANPMTWRPSIFMPRAASRLTLEVVGRRAERLQAISEGDARAEGVACDEQPEIARLAGDGPTFRASFCELWNAINGKRAPWDSNPWVWVIDFRRLETR